MEQRLQKLLSSRGVASRRKAEEMIQEGRVAVNGIVASLGMSADPDKDQITVDGKELPSAVKPVYILLNKPRGYVTTLSDEKGRPNAAQLVEGCGLRVYPVGRLDMDSEGLLLFTNDGEYANSMMHPKHVVDKVYEVHTAGYEPGAERKLTEPIELDGYRIRKPDVQLLKANGSKAFFVITIHEGRNRQIRRMCEAVGMKVTRLKRIQEGLIRLGTLQPGQWRYLTDDEIQNL